MLSAATPLLLLLISFFSWVIVLHTIVKKLRRPRNLHNKSRISTNSIKRRQSKGSISFSIFKTRKKNKCPISEFRTQPISYISQDFSATKRNPELKRKKGQNYFREGVECRRKSRSDGRLRKVEHGSVSERRVGNYGGFFSVVVAVVVIRGILVMGFIIDGFFFFFFCRRIALDKSQAHGIVESCRAQTKV